MSEETVSAKEFWDNCTDPTSTNRYAIQFDRPEGENPEATFSQQVFGQVGFHAEKFAIARCLAHFKATGRGAKQMRVTIKVETDPLDHPGNSTDHWFHAVDGGQREEAV